MRCNRGVIVLDNACDVIVLDNSCDVIVLDNPCDVIVLDNPCKVIVLDNFVAQLSHFALKLMSKAINLV